ncbi:MAG: protein kinase [Myxococcota bacterium]
MNSLPTRGTRIADRFVVQRIAGEGGMGVVYQAHDELTAQPVALKLMVAESADHMHRFRREAAVMSQLVHRHVVRFVDAGIHEHSTSFIAMEWLDGCDLATRLLQGPLSPNDALRLACNLSEALAAAHERGIVHRDIKPRNIFLEGEEISGLKVLDFGVARVNGSETLLTQPGAPIGTPAYMAPEQARGTGTVEPAADIFALGVVLYECLVGETPFAADHALAVLGRVLFDDPLPIRKLLPAMPLELEQAIQAMLLKEPSSRPRDGGEALSILRSVGAVASNGSALPSVVPQPLSRRERQLLSVVAVARRALGRGDATATHRSEHQDATTARDLAARYGAALEVLADGSMIATLGAGVARDQAYHAARLALEMKGTLRNRCAAVVTGRAELAGELPMGEVLERAASLLKNAESDSVLVDELTWGLVEGRFDGAPSRSGVQVTSPRDGLPAKPGSRSDTPCVGRSLELATFTATYQSVVDESVARMLVLVSPAGSGKSRLLRELLDSLPSPQIWTASGDPIARRAPFSVLASLIRGSLGHAAGNKFTDLHHRVSGRLGKKCRDTAGFLGELIGVAPPIPSLALTAARSDPELMRERIQDAALRWLIAEADRHPIVLALEDIHWVDTPTVEFLTHVLSHASDAPILITATGRPEALRSRPQAFSHDAIAVHQLRALSSKASAQLVRTVAGDCLSPEQVDWVVSRAGGNVLYLEELVRAVRHGQGEPPPTVLAMIGSRLSTLPPGLRQILRAASIYGETFTLDGVHALLDSSHREMTLAGFRELVRRKIIVSHSQEYSFRHSLLRDAAYEMLTPSDLRMGHRLAAAWLEQEGTSRTVIAEHLRRSGKARTQAGSPPHIARQA